MAPVIQKDQNAWLPGFESYWRIHWEILLMGNDWIFGGNYFVCVPGKDDPKHVKGWVHCVISCDDDMCLC